MSQQPSFLSATLSCGLRVILAPKASEVVYCGFAVDAGSRDERPGEQGMAHFVEHMLFKGTTHRRACHILNRMEAVGGDLNAFTAKEETTVYCAHLPEDFPRAVELLADIVFCSTFPEEEMEREVEVVCDEIQSYEDSPAELIFDEFDGLLFPQHPLGRNILGVAGELRTYRSAHLRAFVRRLYRPERMVFFAQGPLSLDRVVRLVEKYVAKYAPQAEAVGEAVARVAPSPSAPQQLSVARASHQCHVMLGAPAYDARDPRRTALALLTNLLGGPGMNSRLNVALRERRGLVYNVEANYTAYTDTGAFSIYYGCDPEDAPRCLQLVQAELRRLAAAPLSPSQLRAAKRQLIGQIGVAGDNFENLALDMAKIFLHYGACEERAEVFRRIEAVTAPEMQQVACDLLSRLCSLSYGPR